MLNSMQVTMQSCELVNQYNSGSQTSEVQRVQRKGGERRTHGISLENVLEPQPPQGCLWASG